MGILWYFAPERNATIQLRDLMTANKLMWNLLALSLCLTLILTLILEPLSYYYHQPLTFILTPTLTLLNPILALTHTHTMTLTIILTLNLTLTLDHYTFLGKCPPTPPLSQHFALSDK